MGVGYLRCQFRTKSFFQGIWIWYTVPGCFFENQVKSNSFTHKIVRPSFFFFFKWTAVVCALARDATVNKWIFVSFDQSASRIWVSYLVSVIAIFWVLPNGCQSIQHHSTLSNNPRHILTFECLKKKKKSGSRWHTGLYIPCVRFGNLCVIVLQLFVSRSTDSSLSFSWCVLSLFKIW